MSVTYRNPVRKRVAMSLIFLEMTHRDLARQLDMSQRTLELWLSHPDFVPPAKMRPVAEALGMTYAELMSDSPVEFRFTRP